MRKGLKKNLVFSLAISTSLLAQEFETDQKEVTMSSPQTSPVIDECRGDKLDLSGYSRSDDYDYDVYTTGSPSEREGCSDNSDRKNYRNESKKKSAAQAAQE